jgi:hypothetical protein
MKRDKMKLLIAFIGLIFISNISIAQITTTNVPKLQEEKKSVVYDSTRNFLGSDVQHYIGQVLYLNKKPESLREHGYRNFLIDYREYADQSNVYKCCDNFNSKYSELAGKYFTVLDVYEHPRAETNNSLYGEKYFLELKENESGDIVYFEYDTRYELSYPFIIVGFFEKLIEDLVGKKFVLRNNVIGSSRIDIETAEEFTIPTGQEWECVDVTIEDEYYSLSCIIENTDGNKTTMSYEFIIGEFSDGSIYSLPEAKAYEEKFGKSNWHKILEEKVVVGFTEEMVLLSWGEPDKINRSSSGDQWVYDGQFLYFENEILKAFN